MVEVTQSNFNEIFPSIEKSIRDSAFIAIDCEFTGLSLGPLNENNLFDSLEERYKKLKGRATHFIPCQIGLSTFTKCPKENSYSVDTYVFYIRPYRVGSVDRVFMCQASAIDFLNGYNFDFNKFIGGGIPYVNADEEAQIVQELEDGSICLPYERLQDTRYQEKLNHKINQILVKRKKKNEIPQGKVAFPIDKKYHVYFQLCDIRRRFPKLWAYTEDEMIVVKAVSSEESKKLMEGKAEEKRRVLDYFVGFTKVFRLLKECQKPIVGHNVLLDLMLFYHNFHRNLPDSYEKFKKELHHIFPIVYDTKHIWLNIKEVLKSKKYTGNSNLPTLYGLCKNPPDYLTTLYSPSVLPLNCKKYLDGDFMHESGYDAFTTGYVFLKISSVVASEKVPGAVMTKPLTVKQLLDGVSSFVNKVNIPYFKLKFISLEGSDPPADGPGFLYISRKTSNKTLSHEELNMYFSNHNAIEFKFINGRKAVLAATPSHFIFQKIIKEFEDNPDLIVEEYNFWKHWPLITPTVCVLAVTFSGCLAAWLWNSS